MGGEVAQRLAEEKVLQAIKELDKGDGVLVLDVCTALNVSMEALQPIFSELSRKGDIYYPKRSIVRIVPDSPNLFTGIEKKESSPLEVLQELSEEELAIKAFEKNIKDIAEAVPELEEYYKILDAYIEMVAKGYSHSLLVYGNFGSGKSFRIVSQLAKHNIPFYHYSGAITPLELYHLLHKHNGQILFLDDVGSSLFENPRAIDILKPALQEVAGHRFLNYNSTSEKLEAPARFEYTGKIIIATNELPDSSLSLKALLSRPLLLDLTFSHKQLKQIFHEIAKKPYKTTTEKQRFTVCNWIDKHVTPSCDNLSLRTLIKGFEMIAYNEKQWITLFKPVIKINEKLELLIKIEDKTKKEQLNIWKEEFGLSERTYYRQLKELRKREGLCRKLTL